MRSGYVVGMDRRECEQQVVPTEGCGISGLYMALVFKSDGKRIAEIERECEGDREEERVTSRLEAGVNQVCL